MASRGAMVTGSSGLDFMHRETVAAHYQASAQNKYRLRCCMFFHVALALLMLLKLAADILDKLDIFILEVEELQIPKPLWWEWAWALSPCAAPLVLSSIRRSGAVSLRRARIALLMLEGIPLLYCLLYWSSDVYSYLTAEAGDEDLDIEYWQGLPLGALWYVFCCPALQVLVFQMLFIQRLLAAWTHYKRE